MYVCIYVYIFVHTYIHTYTHTFIYTYTPSTTCVLLHTYTHISYIIYYTSQAVDIVTQLLPAWMVLSKGQLMEPLVHHGFSKTQTVLSSPIASHL